MRAAGVSLVDPRRHDVRRLRARPCRPFRRGRAFRPAGDRPSSASRRAGAPPGGCASTCTATRCGAATRRRRPTSWRRRSSSRASTCCASPTTTRSPARSSSPTGCRAGWSSARSCARPPARSSGCSSPSGCRSGSATSRRPRAIREQGGLVYIPHPFDPMRRNLGEPALRELAELGLVDAIEVLNAKTSLASLNRRARRVRGRARPGRRRGQRRPRARRARRGVRRDARLRRPPPSSSPRCGPAWSSATTGTNRAPGPPASSRRSDRLRIGRTRDQCAAQVRRLFTRSPGTSGHGRMRTLARPSWAAAATVGASRSGTATWMTSSLIATTVASSHTTTPSALTSIGRTDGDVAGERVDHPDDHGARRRETSRPRGRRARRRRRGSRPA